MRIYLILNPNYYVNKINLVGQAPQNRNRSGISRSRRIGRARNAHVAKS